MLEASVQEPEAGKEGGRGKNEAGNHGVLQVGSGEDSELSQKQQGWREELVGRG